MRSTIKAVALLFCLPLYSGTQSTDDAIIEEPFISSDEITSELTGHLINWVRHIDTSSCLSSYERSLIKEFIQEESPMNIYELQVVRKVPLEKLSCLIHRISEDKRPESQSFESGQNIFSLLSAFKKDSETEEDLNLSSIYSLARIRITPSETWRLGMMFEKDSGESFWHKNKGPEYISGYLQIRPIAPVIREVIIGDYRMTCGQGLLYNNYYRKGLTLSDNTLPKYPRNGMSAYQSLDENRAFRGIATRLSMGKYLYLQSGLSIRQLDASTDSMSHHVISFQRSGLHKTENQLMGKDAVRTYTLLSSIEIRKYSHQYALNFMYSRMEQPVGESEKLYRKHYLTGRTDIGVSLSYDLMFGSFNPFGEVTISQSFEPAILSGFLWSPHPSHQLSFVLRHLPSDFEHLNYQTLSHGTGINETGISLGLITRILPELSAEFNVDSHIRNWWSFQNSPHRRSDQVRVRIRYYRRKHFMTYCLFKYLRRNADIDDKNIQETITEHKAQLRFHHSLQVSKGVEWRSRLQLSWHRSVATSMGWLAYQELRYKPIGGRLSFTFRASKYNTANYDTRIYAYEIRPGNKFAIPSFSGSGYRVFINMNYKIGKWQLGFYHGYQQNENIRRNTGIFFQWRK
ncbi:MAG: hypothetical protein R3275_12455 [Saprospiraceae bacterium]|nr:hypothetical protein [Saprospiraceae bacterium]